MSQRSKAQPRGAAALPRLDRLIYLWYWYDWQQDYTEARGILALIFLELSRL